jgi:hypothetical protein
MRRCCRHRILAWYNPIAKRHLIKGCWYNSATFLRFASGFVMQAVRHNWAAIALATPAYFMLGGAWFTALQKAA